MFMGEFEHTIDAKGRVIIPAKFRNQIATPCIVTRGMDHSLTVYPMAEWEKVKERLAQLPTTRGNARKFVRFIFFPQPQNANLISKAGLMSRQY